MAYLLGIVIATAISCAFQTMITEVERLAAIMHGSQRRKFADEPYTAHLIRVKDIVAGYTSSLVSQAAALLHDVLEDTSYKKDELTVSLSALFSKEDAQKIVLLVDELTDRYVKAAYPQWNRRIRKNKEAERLEKVSAEAQTIKYADILDNSLDIVKTENDFAKKYLYESRHLLRKMLKGNAELRSRAVDTIDGLLATHFNVKS